MHSPGLNEEFRIFAGTANPGLAAAITGNLDVPLGACALERFPDGEVAVQLLESVRRKEVFLIQPTSPPVNDHLMQSGTGDGKAAIIHEQAAHHHCWRRLRRSKMRQNTWPRASV